MNQYWKVIDEALEDSELAVSFSGGRSSAVMTKLLFDRYSDTREVATTFANTGCEDHRTLEFVDTCDKKFGWGVVWVEALVNPEPGEGVRHTIVDYETASRNGEPFESVVSKYGIFNQTNPACTARMKTDPMQSYLRSKGFVFGKKSRHWTAVGIRADEMDRVSQHREKYKFIYPLVDLGVTKRGVALEIKKWGFDLTIPHDAWGNCTWCWKKSLRKLMTLAREDPTVFNFPKRMEQKYETFKSDSAASSPEGLMRWFRKYLSVDDIIEKSKEEFILYRDDPWDHGTQKSLFDEELDVGGGCGDGCEIGADE